MNYLEDYDSESESAEDYMFEDDEDEFGEEDDEEINEMLEALMDEADEDEDLAERRRRRSRRARGRRRRRVPTAKGRSAYRSPVAKGYVTQKQMKAALGRVGKDVRRNASGIKAVNMQLKKVDTRLSGVVTVNRVQSKRIAGIDKRIKMDGALDFAESFNAATSEINLYQVFKGAIKSGLLGDTKGALANPLVIGGIGLVLNNPGILGGFLGGGRTT